MKPPPIVKLRDLKRIMARYDVAYVPGGKHMAFVGSGGTRFPMPHRKGSDDVERSYVNALRRAFRLTPAHGVSNDEFYGG